MSEINKHDTPEEREPNKISGSFDMERVQFLDMDSFRRVNECVLIVMREYARLEHPPTEWELEKALMQGYPRSDGSLLVRSVSPDGRHQDTIVAPMGWRQLSAEEYKKFDECRTLRKGQDPDGYEASIDHLAELIRKPGDHFSIAEAGKVQSHTDDAEHADAEPESPTPSATSSVGQSYAIVLDRSNAARDLVQQIYQQSDFMVNIRAEAVEFWQQSHHPYLVLWGMLDGTDKLILTPVDMTALLADALPTIMKRVNMTGGTCTFLIGTEISDCTIIEKRLTSLQSVVE